MNPADSLKLPGDTRFLGHRHFGELCHGLSVGEQAEISSGLCMSLSSVRTKPPTRIGGTDFAISVCFLEFSSLFKDDLRDSDFFPHGKHHRPERSPPLPPPTQPGATRPPEFPEFPGWALTSSW